MEIYGAGAYSDVGAVLSKSGGYYFSINLSTRCPEGAPVSPYFRSSFPVSSTSSSIHRYYTVFKNSRVLKTSPLSSTAESVFNHQRFFFILFRRRQAKQVHLLIQQTTLALDVLLCCTIQTPSRIGTSRGDSLSSIITRNSLKG